MAIRVLAADDHAIIRQGLKLLFAQTPDLDLVGEAADGAEAVELFTQLAPDVVIMDMAMPVMDGVEATCSILRERPDAKVLVLSMHAEPYYIKLAQRAGAVGYVLKETAFESLADAIHQVLDGKTVFPETTGD